MAQGQGPPGPARGSRPGCWLPLSAHAVRPRLRNSRTTLANGRRGSDCSCAAHPDYLILRELSLCCTHPAHHQQRLAARCSLLSLGELCRAVPVTNRSNLPMGPGLCPTVQHLHRNRAVPIPSSNLTLRLAAAPTEGSIAPRLATWHLTKGGDQGSERTRSDRDTWVPSSASCVFWMNTAHGHGMRTTEDVMAASISDYRHPFSYCP